MKKGLFSDQKQHFSIRKYSFGAASVLIGASLLLSVQVSADETINSTNQATLVAQETVTTDTTTDTAEATCAQEEVSAESSATTLSVAKTQASEEVVTASPLASSEAIQTSTANEMSEVQAVQAVGSEVTDSTNQTYMTSETVESTTTTTSKLACQPETVTLDTNSMEIKENTFSNETVASMLRDSNVAVAANSTDSSAKDLPDTGYYVYTQKTEIKNQPTASEPVAFYGEAGDKIFYDKVLTNDGYQWISYNSHSGVRRYAAISKLNQSTTKAKEVSGTLSIEQLTPQGFGVIVSDVKDTDGIVAVKVPVWSDKSGQDDIIWYDAQRQSNGNYKASISTSQHQNEKGNYNVHLYYQETSGKMQGVATKVVTVPTTSSRQTLPASGSYTFTEEVPVKNEPKISATTEFTFDKGETLKLYDKVLEADNHQWISYVSYSGTRRYIPVAPLKAQAEQKVTGKIDVTNQTTTGFDIVVSNIKDTKDISSVKVPVWTDKNDQDDIIWYDGVKQSDGTYKVTVKLSDHKNERGDYNIHLYYQETDGKMQGVATHKATISEPKESRTGSLSIQNQSNGDFNVIVSNVSDSKGIAAVKVPVWTEKNAQDDIIWYDGVKQSDGTYKVVVKLGDHKNERGDYNIHLYYVEQDGSIKGVGTTKITIASQTSQADTKNTDLPSQGAYTFTKDTEVKNEPKTSASVAFVLKKGERVNYDKVLDSDGKQWLSYVSYSGTCHYAEIGQTSTTSNRPSQAPSQVLVNGDLSIENKNSQGFDVLIKNVKSNQEIKGIKVPVWSEAGGQDDIIWYDATKVNNSTYKTSVKVSDHKNNYGSYNLHLYYVQADGNLKGVAATTTTVDKPKGDTVTGQVSIENQTDQGFDVVISNATDSKGIKTVKVPVWSETGGQDDIIWYNATNQGNNTYKTSVKYSEHKNDTELYNVHVYYEEIDGAMTGLAATSITVKAVQANKNELTYNGSYYSAQGKYDQIVIVNKKHPLSENYNPGENAQAKAAFTQLRNDMINQGYNVGYGYSGFRSYATQTNLYQNYVNRDGQAAADRYSARAGYSEHQTGLAYDLTDKSGNLLEDTNASNWLKNNACNYGFIIRYQPGKQATTGFMEEAWHIRYIGKEAKEVHDSGMTLEEYFGVEGGDYGTSTSTSGQTTPTSPTIASQGTYTFSKRSSIKAEAKQSSLELAYYEAGQSVNYDKVLDSDSAKWISYLSYSGARRYIAIS